MTWVTPELLESAGTRLRWEPLVVVIVAGEDELGACGDERVEEGLHGCAAAVVSGENRGLCRIAIVHLFLWAARSLFSHASWAPLVLMSRSELRAMTCQAPMSWE